MNTNALYTIRENGEVSYFFSEHMGGFSFPFKMAEAVRAVQEGEESKPAAEILPSLQWTGNPDVEVPVGQTFRRLTESEYMEMLDSTIDNGDIPFTIVLNMDAEAVTFTFNHNCAEFNHLPDVTIPLHGGEFEVCGDSLDELAQSVWHGQADGEAKALGIEKIYANMITDHARTQPERYQGPAMSM